MNYKEELDILLDKWEKESKKLGYNGFCYDGLMFKGNIYHYISEKDGKEKWGREKGEENELWNTSSKKILFLMKDTNDNPNQDCREWLGRQHKSIITHKFFKNIALWLLGLYSIDRLGNFIPFDEVNIPEKYSKAFDEIPFSIVNCKKESGKGKISNSELWNYCTIFKSYLKQQVEVLKPNIIVCGGGSSIVLKIARELIYPDLIFEKFDNNNWIYYNIENDIILIDSYHPSAMISYESVYSGMMKSYSEFIKSVL